MTVLEAVTDEFPDTYRSVLLAVDGDAPAGFCRTWHGTVLWVGTSPFRPRHRRRNWYVGIFHLQPPAAPSWSEKDVRTETLAAEEPGGQRANRICTAVRVTHVPTNLTATAREECSQRQNRRLALARLSVLIEENAERSRHERKQQLWALHHTLVRGNPVRIYEGPEFTERPARISEPEGTRVRLASFNGLVVAPPDTEPEENYWLLVGRTGKVIAPENGFGRVLVKLDVSVTSLGLHCHNDFDNPAWENSLWIRKSDLEPI